MINAKNVFLQILNISKSMKWWSYLMNLRELCPRLLPKNDKTLSVKSQEIWRQRNTDRTDSDEANCETLILKWDLRSISYPKLS